MMEDRRAQPTLLVILLALLGLAALPRWTATEAPESKSPPAKTEGEAGSGGGSTSAGPANSSENPDLQVLEPLIRLADDGTRPGWIDEGPSPAFGDPARRKIVMQLVERLRGGDGSGSVHGLIALLPDPVRTSGGHEYDPDLDGLQRAMETAGFVLAAARFPWADPAPSERRGPEKPREVRLQLAFPLGVDGPWKVAGTLSSPDEPARSPLPKPEDHPGLMVFRKHGTNQIVAVFLALETPTLGLNKPQFVWCLDLVDAIAGAGGSKGRRTLPILGPCYSGTAETLSQALEGWLAKHPSRYEIPIVAGSASELTVADFRGPVDAFKGAKITFHAALYRRRFINKVLIDYLSRGLGRPIRVAMLTESNTGFGDIYKSIKIKGESEYDGGGGPVIHQFPFPIHVSALRASYERHGLLRNQSSQLFRSAGRLDLPAEPDERTRDVPPSMTPEFSTRVDELVMVQILTAIARGQYDAVGITGTSSRDTIFLAQLINRFQPDAQIFTNQADLLFTQPQTLSDLRGMLIGSTYPLYAPNRHWSYPFQEASRTFFNQDVVQGIYNSTLYLLGLTLADPALKQPALLLEFAPPFDVGPKSPHRPPIWIGVVSNRGIYPLHVEVDRGVLEGDAGTTRLLEWSTAPKPAGTSKARSAILAPELRPYFRPSYHTFWKVMQLFSLMLVLVMGCLAFGELLWARAKEGIGVPEEDRPGADGRAGSWRIPKALEPLAQALAWVRVRSSYPSEDGRGRSIRLELGPGPGPHLLLAHLGLFLLFVAMNWPFFVSLENVPARAYFDGWAGLAWAGFVALCVSLASSALAALRPPIVLRRPWLAVLIVGIGAFGGLLAVWWLVPSGPDPRLALDRIVVVTSGISPIFPLLFVGLTGGFCLWADLRRRYLSEQIPLKDLKLTPAESGESPDEVAESLALLDFRLEQLRAAFRKPRRIFQRPPLVPTLIFAGFLSSFVFLALVPLIHATSSEGWIFQLVFGGMFFVLAGFLTLRVYHLFVLWGSLKEVLEGVARLPMARSFERLPVRVARWFFESPAPKNRSVLVGHQAEALATRCLGPVRDALSAAFAPGPGPGEWQELAESLHGFDQLESGPRWEQPPRGHPSPPPSARADQILVKLLTRIWEGMPLSWLFAGEKARGEGDDSRDGASGGGWPIAPEAAELLARRPASAEAGEAVSGEAADPPSESHPESPGSRSNAGPPAVAPGATDLRRAVREWAEMAEDLIGLQLLRHLSQFLAHLRIMSAVVVVGLFALLLAINSYPFPWQNRVQFFLAVLIALAAVAILRIVLGINRDETISRVADTLPGRLKLDRDLVSSLVVYILPLIGILAAVSYDVSDLLRVWLDPVFRNLM